MLVPTVFRSQNALLGFECIVMGFLQFAMLAIITFYTVQVFPYHSRYGALRCHDSAMVSLISGIYLSRLPVRRKELCGFRARCGLWRLVFGRLCLLRLDASQLLDLIYVYIKLIMSTCFWYRRVNNDWWESESEDVGSGGGADYRFCPSLSYLIS